MTKIGLKIHCQLNNLESKLFCSCKADYRGLEPNSNICPVCIGLLGSLPILNKSALEKAMVIALALKCQLPDKVSFYRKNYFSPDLPKNYQITQHDIYGLFAIGNHGSIKVGEKIIRTRRIYLEEEPGKLIYEGSSEKNKITLVDYNSSGTSVVEIVTEPDFENTEQVRVFLNVLANLLENLSVSDPHLEGAIRIDCGVSIPLGEKIEIENINSFHDLEKALDFEITRQQSLAEEKIPIEKETRYWDKNKKITLSVKSPKDENDYRYFIEGDIPWIVLDPDHIDRLKKEILETVNF